MGNEIGARLRNLRLANDLTLEDVTNRLGLAKQTLYKYEMGIITNIPLTKIEELAKIYGVEPEEIVGWDVPEKKQDVSPDHRWVLKQLPNMSQEDVRQLRRILEAIDEEKYRNQ